jgi:hypothetical protein
MDLTLVLLLLAALGFGMRLERRLKTLKEGQASFVGAVADLDRAAQRAEAGLADLRAATEEAVDRLGGRIDKARELAARLERLTADAARPVARAPAPASAPPLQARAPVRAPASARPPPSPDPEAAAEELVLRLTERQALAAAPVRRLDEPRPVMRSRASIDDDLFEASPRLAGGRR